MTDPNQASAVELRDRLVDYVSKFSSCAVAFSAGVDSAVLCKAAQVALGDRAVAVTGVSASLAEGELEEARQLASLIGIRHEVVETQEFSNPDYIANAPNRCYYCKDELFTQLATMQRQLNVDVVFYGANTDDAGDYRPGMQAANEHGVEGPLAACGFSKAMVRTLAAYWELPVAEKPATPCLASRVAYGEEVTPERLERIDRGEQFLRSLGLGTVRVRYHQGDLARLEVPVDAVSQLCEPSLRESVIAEFLKLGFKYITLDLQGFRSGSQNVVLSVESLGQYPTSSSS